ncbi:hypothetical protein EJ08DRAFT_676192 [Tothia fuscella]|uniref:Uncharacterized protein n=1 Tax=Tothia fuscella TaxID=1048955 RepID=A0A9P4NZT1_9PEZI|nr:hypothetical protein EJ08DRAFT_676192 [Tothia fuscella]
MVNPTTIECCAKCRTIITLRENGTCCPICCPNCDKKHELRGTTFVDEHMVHLIRRFIKERIKRGRADEEAAEAEVRSLEREARILEWERVTGRDAMMEVEVMGQDMETELYYGVENEDEGEDEGEYEGETDVAQAMEVDLPVEAEAEAYVPKALELQIQEGGSKRKRDRFSSPELGLNFRDSIEKAQKDGVDEIIKRPLKRRKAKPAAATTTAAATTDNTLREQFILDDIAGVDGDATETFEAIDEGTPATTTSRRPTQVAVLHSIPAIGTHSTTSAPVQLPQPETRSPAPRQQGLRATSRQQQTSSRVGSSSTPIILDDDDNDNETDLEEVEILVGRPLGPSTRNHLRQLRRNPRAPPRAPLPPTPLPPTPPPTSNTPSGTK